MVRLFFPETTTISSKVTFSYRVLLCDPDKVHWKNCEFNEQVEVWKEFSVSRLEAKMGLKKDTNWTLVPGTERDIDAVRDRCRQLVRRRATSFPICACLPT
jgi:hypothetical protein